MATRAAPDSAGATTTPRTRRYRGGVGDRVVRAASGVLCVAALAAGGLLALAVLLGGETRLLVILLAALAGWRSPVLLAALLAALVARSRVLIAVSAAAFVTSVVLAPPFPAGEPAASTGADETGADQAALEVLALTVQYSRADADAVVAEVVRHRADVLVLTELTPAGVTALRRAGLDDVLEYSFVRAADDASGAGIWSRSRLADGREVPDTGFAALRAQFQPSGDEPVIVFAVRASPPVHTSEWAADMRILERAVEPLVPQRASIVVAGDLNAGVRNGPLRRLLDGGLADAGTRTSWAWQGNTWPSDRWIPPVIRIDHVLTSASVRAQTVETFDVPGTDHQGVRARLLLPSPGGSPD